MPAIGSILPAQRPKIKSVDRSRGRYSGFQIKSPETAIKRGQARKKSACGWPQRRGSGFEGAAEDFHKFGHPGGVGRPGGGCDQHAVHNGIVRSR